MEPPIIDLEKYGDLYSESKLWDKIKRVARKAGLKVVYAVLLLVYALQSPDLSVADKARIYGALGYFLLPLDLIPDFVAITGFADDLAALVWALHSIYMHITPDVQAEAKAKLHEWFGNYNEEDLTLNF